MVERTALLAREYGVQIELERLTWEELPLGDPFSVVFCVGNSLAHAEGATGRRRALRNMRNALAPGGRLVLTSRTWELVRAGGSGIEVADSVVVRNGRRGIVIHNWCLAADWRERHRLDIAVALVDDQERITTVAESLDFWPFRHEELIEDLHVVGLVLERTTYDPSVERYLVTARRAA